MATFSNIQRIVLLGKVFAVKYATQKHEKPLTKEEEKQLGIANVFAMDFEADGGTLPPEIDDLVLKPNISPSDARKLIQWAYTRAPGTYGM